MTAIGRRGTVVVIGNENVGRGECSTICLSHTTKVFRRCKQSRRRNRNTRDTGTQDTVAKSRYATGEDVCSVFAHGVV